uniref:UPAR/Ly6 domain-containing protein n=1 Tax=Caenorhabditis japonica TaxID=281687 RepID=A0A8R1I8J3_CAEJA
MFCKVVLLLLPSFCLFRGLNSLECIFEAVVPTSQLNVHRGVDTCDISEEYCATVNINGIYAKGCSKTAAKITESSLSVSCTAAICNPDGSLCCCKGNKCNGSKVVSVVMPFFVLGAVKFFL